MSSRKTYTLASSIVGHFRDYVSFWRLHGFVNGFKNLKQVKELGVGQLKGVDRFGHQYWEGPTRVTQKNRWVVYPNSKNVDPSAIPAEWHSWLHHMGDETPITHPPKFPLYAREHLHTALSFQGAKAHYLPAGHLLSPTPTTFAKTGAGASDALDGAYESWAQGVAHPEQNKQYQVLTERK